MMKMVFLDSRLSERWLMRLPLSASHVLLFEGCRLSGYLTTFSSSPTSTSDFLSSQPHPTASFGLNTYHTSSILNTRTDVWHKNISSSI